MASVKPSAAENSTLDDNIEPEIPKMYLKLQSLIEFDTFVITHGPFTSVDSGKFKLIDGFSYTLPLLNFCNCNFLPFTF